VAAQPSPAPSPSLLVPRGTLAEVYPELGSLAAATAFTITEEWGGMEDLKGGAGASHVKEQYTLIRTQTDFLGVGTGDVRFWVSIWSDAPDAERRFQLPVQIPADSAERFLRALTTVPVADGPPYQEGDLDVTMNLEFAISSDAGPVRIFGYLGWDPDRWPPMPWAVEYRGRQMIIDSAGPWEAYQLIRPYVGELRQQTRPYVDELRKTYSGG
jgi:hypothetical protein